MGSPPTPRVDDSSAYFVPADADEEKCKIAESVHRLELFQN